MQLTEVKRAGGHRGMNYSAVGGNPSEAPYWSATDMSPRQRARLERDRERGYSVNIKQVVLAFTVEFVIIGLILTNNVATVEQIADLTPAKTVQALLFPIAMAMVELARVP